MNWKIMTGSQAGFMKGYCTMVHIFNLSPLAYLKSVDKYYKIYRKSNKLFFRPL